MDNETQRYIRASEDSDAFVITILCFASLHGLGLLFVIVNIIFLICTRGHGSARIGKRMIDLEIRRCCKIRGAVACNILIVYHIVLIAVELFIAVLLSFPQTQNEYMKIVLWLFAGVNYGILIFCCLPVSMVHDSYETYNHIGPVHGCNALELFHFVVFWVCAIFMITCRLTNCDCLPIALETLGLGVAVIPLIIAYLGMVAGSSCNKYSFTVYSKVTSKHKAVEILKRKLQEAPSIEWHIRCGHRVRNEQSDHSKYWNTQFNQI